MLKVLDYVVLSICSLKNQELLLSEKKYTGGVKLSVYRDISTTPVFAKSGAIIPLVGSEIGMGVDLPEVVDWYVFPGKQHSFEMLEDQNTKTWLSAN